MDLRRCWCEQASRTITTRESRNGSEVWNGGFAGDADGAPAGVCGLDQFHPLQTRMPVLADDDVVVHRNAQWRRDVDDRACHLDIGLRGRRIAGGMVVQDALETTYRIEKLTRTSPANSDRGRQ